MAKLAILGFGTVGSGVLEVLRRNAAGIQRRLGRPLEVKYICDVRDFSDSEDAALFVQSPEAIWAGDEVDIVVETIGGTKPAYDFVKTALQSGRHVVTSNKELVSTHGAELLALAKQNEVCFLFEASVGGGTPIITPMHQCLAANHISSVKGIINGTTNFMLTRMQREGMDFDAALKEAQVLGYAETIDPSSDVDGIDAARKVSILASLACGSHVYPQNVPTRGIRTVTPADMEAAAALGCAAKLIAWAEKPEGGRLACGVEPMLVPKSNQLAGVEDVFNAVMVEGDMLGDVVFYGKGAGKLPTASAVVADAIDALKDGVKIHDSLFWQPAEPIDGYYTDAARHDYYVRLAAGNTEVFAELEGAKAVAGQNAAVLPQRSAAELAAEVARLEAAGAKVGITMKMMEE
jgi:homoserine dehydrogenase